MYDGVRAHNLTAALFTTVFCIRRLVMVLALLLMKDGDPFTLIYIYLLIMSLNFFYLVVASAHTEAFLNELELINELCLICVLYTLLFFVKANQLDTEVVWRSGVGTISVLSFMFFINFGYMLAHNIAKTLQEGKAMYAKLKAKKQERLKKYRERVTRMT